MDLVRIVCHYCGHASSSMLEAVRHDSERPESCLAWLGRSEIESLVRPIEEDAVLRNLTVQGEGNLEDALEEYFERIQPVYR
jgi:hypothetical protein